MIIPHWGAWRTNSVVLRSLTMALLLCLFYSKLWIHVPPLWSEAIPGSMLRTLLSTEDLLLLGARHGHPGLPTLPPASPAPCSLLLAGLPPSLPHLAEWFHWWEAENMEKEPAALEQTSPWEVSGFEWVFQDSARFGGQMTLRLGEGSTMSELLVSWESHTLGRDRERGGKCQMCGETVHTETFSADDDTLMGRLIDRSSSSAVAESSWHPAESLECFKCWFTGQMLNFTLSKPSRGSQKLIINRFHLGDSVTTSAHLSLIALALTTGREMQ